MAYSINPGDFDTKVDFQSVAVTIGTQGERLATYTTFISPFVKVERDIDESVTDSNLEASQNLRLTSYKIASLTTRCRCLIASKPYEIRSIDTISRLSPYCYITLHAIDG